jgi:penicillin amidase
MKKSFLIIAILFCLAGTYNATAQTVVSSNASSKLKVVGIKENVEVIRDKWGVNHIYAKNEHDLFFTQGYCAAKDRLFQFELWRRQATGTLSEILGEREFKRDLGTRLFKFRGDMQKELNHYHPRGASIIQSYVDGVNAYIKEVNSNPSLLPIEFKYKMLCRYNGITKT